MLEILTVEAKSATRHLIQFLASILSLLLLRASMILELTFRTSNSLAMLTNTATTSKSLTKVVLHLSSIFGLRTAGLISTHLRLLKRK